MVQAHSFTYLKVLELVDRSNLGFDVFKRERSTRFFQKKIYSLMVERVAFNYLVNGSTPFISIVFVFYFSSIITFGFKDLFVFFVFFTRFS
jgi:hypothetical protein